MSYGRRWKPSKTKAKEFAMQMNKIDEFCAQHGIKASHSNDSYYFVLNGQSYRVSNHSIESSNSKAFNWTGEKVRDEYHPDGRSSDVIYIHASKTRIIDIYNDLQLGYQLDGKGYKKEDK